MKHIKLQKGPDGTFFLADCKMFHSIVVSLLLLIFSFGTSFMFKFRTLCGVFHVDL